MDRLPPELLHEICARLFLHDLCSLLTVNRALYDHSIDLIYASIRHIHLFSTGDDADAPSLQCLRSLATSKRASSAVRHLAIRGVPWQDASTLQDLSDAMQKMERLVSLDMSGAPSLETRLLSAQACAHPDFLRNLEAIHVTHADSAIDLCNGRSISTVRIALDMTSTRLLSLLALTGARLRQLQVILCDIQTPAAVGNILRHLATAAPLLVTLGLECRVERASNKDLQTFSKELPEMMTAFGSLVQLSMVVTPMGSTASSPECPLATALFSTCPNLEYLELQWKAWTVVDSTITESALPWSVRMRTTWAYAARESPVGDEIAKAVARKRSRALQLKDPGLPGVDVGADTPPAEVHSSLCEQRRVPSRIMY